MTAGFGRARAFLIDGTVDCEHIMIATQSSFEFAHTAWRSDAVGPDKRTLKEACYLLLNCSLFGGLRPDERAEVVALARVRTFNAGETVFAIGSPGDQMMALLSGIIRISVPSSGGKELLLAMIQPGEVFGELAVLDGKERSADAVAETACTVAILERRDILSFFERNPSAWPSLVKVLCQRLRHTNQVFAEVALLELPVRLAKAMLRVLHAFWNAAARLAEMLPRPPLTRNQVELMQIDTTAVESRPGFSALGISPRSLEEELEAMLKHNKTQTQNDAHPR